MQLSIDRTNRTGPIRIVGSREKLVFDKPYPLADHEGHNAIVRSAGHNAILIDVKFGKKLIRRESVQLLSSIAGRKADGSPASSPCILDIRPDRPAFPIAGLVETLMKHGIARSRITPLTDSSFTETPASHSLPDMISDGAVSKLELPAAPHRDLMCRTYFTVIDATWAMLAYLDAKNLDGHVSHIYLWMTAADKVEEIMVAIGLIESGDAKPKYSE